MPITKKTFLIQIKEKTFLLKVTKNSEVSRKFWINVGVVYVANKGWLRHYKTRLFYYSTLWRRML